MVAGEGGLVASEVESAGFAEEEPGSKLHTIDLAVLGEIEHTDLQAVLWGKLLLNLNNAVNALSGLPVKVQLSQRRHRRVVARLAGTGAAAARRAMGGGRGRRVAWRRRGAGL